MKIGEKCGLMPLYAFRLKGVRGDSWRIFRIDSGELEGKLSILARRIPVCPLTSTGKPHLFWDQGMPLHKFLALVCRETEQKKSMFNPIQERTITEEITFESETETPHWMKGFIR